MNERTLIFFNDVYNPNKKQPPNFVFIEYAGMM